MRIEPLVTADHLSKTYRHDHQPVTAVRDVSLCINPGEFVAIVGRSGSGKSTLLSLLGGLDQPTGGEVRYGDTWLQRLTPNQAALFRRQNIGFLFQSVDLLPSLTALQNVTLPCALDGVAPSVYTPRALFLLESVGLKQLADALPDQLSGGERQRVGIARALANHPRLILADEPTGSLDQVTGNGVIELLKEAARKDKTALVIVTHDRDIARQADRILQIQDGQLEQ